MPYVIRSTRRLARLVPALSAGVIAVLGAAAPASAQTPAPSECVAPSFSQPFARWGDTAQYTLSPGGSFEAGAPGWTLTGGATVVGAADPFGVGGLLDRRALSIPPGGVAVSAPMCVDETYPSFRFFARNPGASPSNIRVEVLWTESGVTHAGPVGIDRKPGAAWAPVESLSLPSENLSRSGLEPVTFRFTVEGDGGRWQVDDLYVDPYMRR
jgi:hypothetical protein